MFCLVMTAKALCRVGMNVLGLCLVVVDGVCHCCSIVCAQIWCFCVYCVSECSILYSTVHSCDCYNIHVCACFICEYVIWSKVLIAHMSGKRSYFYISEVEENLKCDVNS